MEVGSGAISWEWKGSRIVVPRRRDWKRIGLPRSERTGHSVYFLADNKGIVTCRSTPPFDAPDTEAPQKMSQEQT